jgi:hypothetical protein
MIQPATARPPGVAIIALVGARPEKFSSKLVGN